MKIKPRDFQHGVLDLGDLGVREVDFYFEEGYLVRIDIDEDGETLANELNPLIKKKIEQAYAEGPHDIIDPFYLAKCHMEDEMAK
jgi:hypothetical protein